jgi:hypothetical protein
VGGWVSIVRVVGERLYHHKSGAEENAGRSFEIVHTNPTPPTLPTLALA